MLHNLIHHQGLDGVGIGRETHRRESNATNKASRRRSSGLRFFASAPTSIPETAAKSQKRWEADYLKDLRDHRPARPGGSRPLPGREDQAATISNARGTSAATVRPLASANLATASQEPNERSSSALSHRHTRPDVQNIVAQGHHENHAHTQDSQNQMIPVETSETASRNAPSSLVAAGAYQEGGLRWMEKQEAKSIRAALEDMDSMEETNLKAAAQAEASELVRQHRLSGGGRFTLPNRQRNYREHLEKGAHARSLSQALEVCTIMNNEDPFVAAATESQEIASPSEQRPASSHGYVHDNTLANGQDAPQVRPSSHLGHALWDSPERKAYMNMTFPVPLRKPLSRRRSSGARAKDSSGSVFRNPDDKIYEEPQETSQQINLAASSKEGTNSALTTKTRNEIPSHKVNSEPQLRLRNSMVTGKPVLNRTDIHKNPPSQSRDPSYTKNDVFAPLDECAGDESDTASTKGGREIRSDDIRAATSKKMRDRSPRLPAPTVVSDKPGRPIISFDMARSQSNPTTMEPTQTAQNRPHSADSAASSLPISISSPLVPMINVQEVPTIQLPSDDNSLPSSDQSSSHKNPGTTASRASTIPRPLPRPVDRPGTNSSSRPTAQHSATAPSQTSRFHWTPSQSRATTQCSSCALSISGRVVSAAGQRFHPHCFACHHCAAALECVAFYPEPEPKREERIARINARMNGNCVPEEKPGETAADDGDESLRFYCHLDFHELFSPRCKSCKTPIESEVIVACGSTWHVGHFFCAECGDPFDAQTPFVERNGYAWCVGCHAGRFSGKCKGCRKPVLKEGIRALDAEWHASCFVCTVSRLLWMREVLEMKIY